MKTRLLKQLRKEVVSRFRLSQNTTSREMRLSQYSPFENRWRERKCYSLDNISMKDIKTDINNIIREEFYEMSSDYLEDKKNFLPNPWK